MAQRNTSDFSSLQEVNLLTRDTSGRLVIRSSVNGSVLWRVHSSSATSPALLLPHLLRTPPALASQPYSLGFMSGKRRKRSRTGHRRRQRSFPASTRADVSGSSESVTTLPSASPPKVDPNPSQTLDTGVASPVNIAKSPPNREQTSTSTALTLMSPAIIPLDNPIAQPQETRTQGGSTMSLIPKSFKFPSPPKSYGNFGKVMQNVETNYSSRRPADHSMIPEWPGYDGTVGKTFLESGALRRLREFFSILASSGYLSYNEIFLKLMLLSSAIYNALSYSVIHVNMYRYLPEAVGDSWACTFLRHEFDEDTREILVAWPDRSYYAIYVVTPPTAQQCSTLSLHEQKTLRQNPFATRLHEFHEKVVEWKRWERLQDDEQFYYATAAVMTGQPGSDYEPSDELTEFDEKMIEGLDCRPDCEKRYRRLQHFSLCFTSSSPIVDTSFAETLYRKNYYLRSITGGPADVPARRIEFYREREWDDLAVANYDQAMHLNRNLEEFFDPHGLVGAYILDPKIAEEYAWW